MKIKVVCTNVFLVETEEDEYTAETNAENKVALLLIKKQKELPVDILKWNTFHYKTKILTDEEMEKGGWQWSEI